ncbi:DUF5313 family protein, partial [uncultured Gordonia sp.]
MVHDRQVTSVQRTKPNAWEYVKYAYGARLPKSMLGWVTNDLAGPGASVR